ncbi:hypothetical protein FB561_2044 [Kribbella amoyensis]|uniref:GAF domain-containing protein n=1 Tax=Kribbella amoyensis TaxID=996641 RepID=A0A561BQ02_9ACTN|nr:GAF domain-containing protein [Kribbella amoyensis]TWD80946.1 hypothetical protein FB561_2044 [Kribbella amoyensis]
MATDSSPVRIPVYRAPLRSRRDDVTPDSTVDRALVLGLCGFGGILRPPPIDLDDAVAGLAAAYDVRSARRLRRFAEVADGAFVWTREPGGDYHLGRIEGPWFYDDAPEAIAVDLVQVRRCSWRAVDPVRVPGGVQETFDRGGRNFQRIRNPEVEIATARLGCPG